MDVNAQTFWRKCSSCKKPIAFKQKYYVCNVSTCNGLRTGYVFCGIACFESHLPGARHRDAGAIEKVAGSTPYIGEAEAAAETKSPQRIIVKSTVSASGSPNQQNLVTAEVLIIASRLKDYITARSDFNTSASVMDVLSDHVRVVSDRAIENARADGRKTVLDRDFDFLKK